MVTQVVAANVMKDTIIPPKEPRCAQPVALERIVSDRVEIAARRVLVVQPDGMLLALLWDTI